MTYDHAIFSQWYIKGFPLVKVKEQPYIVEVSLKFKITAFKGRTILFYYINKMQLLWIYFNFSIVVCQIWITRALSFIYICLSIYFISIYLSFFLSIYLSFSLSIYLSFSLSIYLSFYKSMYNSSIYISTCLNII